MKYEFDTTNKDDLLVISFCWVLKVLLILKFHISHFQELSHNNFQETKVCRAEVNPGAKKRSKPARELAGDHQCGKWPKESLKSIILWKPNYWRNKVTIYCQNGNFSGKRIDRRSFVGKPAERSSIWGLWCMPVLLDKERDTGVSSRHCHSPHCTLCMGSVW